MSYREISVSVCQELAERVKSRLGNGDMSDFVTRALENELERVSLDDYLQHLDEVYGHVPQGLVEEFDQLWPS